MRATIFRAVVRGLLVAALAVPAGDLRAWAETASRQQQTEQQKQPPQYAISVEVPAVNVDIVVTDQHGDVLSGFNKQNFRVFDNGVPQTVTNFAPTEAPITIVMLMEFSNIAYGWFAYTAKYWSYDFLNHLKPNDWVALVTFSMRPRIDVDFTQNKMEVQSAIASLYFPGFSEANLFDALLDTLDRLQDVKGRKSILVMASGFDTFSRHTLDDVLKRLKQTEVTIFCVGVAEQLFTRYPSGGGIGYLQARNELSAFAKATGGYAWFPRFDGELPAIFNSVAGFLRNQYSLAYTPTGVPLDGKFHKIKVEVIGNNGQPFEATDQKGKKLKLVVYAREGYVLPKAKPGD